MLRVKPPKTKWKPTPQSCAFDNRVYEVYADNILMSQHERKRDALGEASRLRKSRRSRLGVDVRYKSICTWASGSDICQYWKKCYDEKGTTFTQSWGKKMVMLLKMKQEARQPAREPKKDKGLNQFF